MGAINISTAVKQMDGVFGCKVSVKYKGDESSPIITFRKKNIIEFFCDFFSHDDAKIDQKFNVIFVLHEIATDLSEKNDGEVRSLIKKYEANSDLIDFKEIRRVLRRSFSNQFPPIVSAQPAKEVGETAIGISGKPDGQQNAITGTDLNSVPKYQTSKTAEDRFFSTPESNEELVDVDYANTDEMEKVLGYGNSAAEKLENLQAQNSSQELENKTEKSTFGILSEKKIFPQKFSSAQSEKEEFEKLYMYRIGECIRNKTYSVELVRGPDGDVSDDNLDALAETILSVEWLTKKPVFVSFAEKDDTKFRAISNRLDSAFIGAIAEQGNPYAPERAIDLETVKREMKTFRTHTQQAPLNM